MLEIGLYIARDSQKLADSPFTLGQRCEGTSPELRRHNFKRYAIVYRPVTDGIELVGVFHGSRELEAIFSRLNERAMARPPRNRK